MGNYTISDVRMYEGDRDTRARNVVLRANSRRVTGFGRSTENSTDIRTLRGTGDNVINESYIDLTLDQLRILDGDPDAQEAYLRPRSRFPESDNLGLFVVRLQIGDGQRLEPSDHACLMSLLDRRRNDIPLMPLLHFGRSFETPDRIRLYGDFVRAMVETGRCHTRMDGIAMSIPAYIPSRRIGELFSLYDDIGPTFVAMDLGNRRVDSVPDGRYDAVMGRLGELDGERSFLYGINVKPHGDHGAAVPAMDIQSPHWSLNAVGPAHTGRFGAMPLGFSWEEAGRILDRRSAEYVPMDVGRLPELNDWVRGVYGFRFGEDPGDNAFSAYPYIRRYNFTMANGMLAELSESLNRGETEMVDRLFDMLPEGSRPGGPSHGGATATE